MSFKATAGEVSLHPLRFRVFWENFEILECHETGAAAGERAVGEGQPSSGLPFGRRRN